MVDGERLSIEHEILNIVSEFLTVDFNRLRIFLAFTAPISRTKKGKIYIFTENSSLTYNFRRR